VCAHAGQEGVGREHHYGRDAALGAGALGGLAAKHHRDGQHDERAYGTTGDRGYGSGREAGTGYTSGRGTATGGVGGESGTPAFVGKVKEFGIDGEANERAHADRGYGATGAGGYGEGMRGAPCSVLRASMFLH
jgi:hypothetical protein